MALLTKYLTGEDPHWLGGRHVVYTFPNGWGLSVIPYRGTGWEVAVLNPEGELDYTTPLTSDVACFDTDAETNAFIARAAREIGGGYVQ